MEPSSLPDREQRANLRRAGVIGQLDLDPQQTDKHGALVLHGRADRSDGKYVLAARPPAPQPNVVTHARDCPIPCTGIRFGPMRHRLHTAMLSRNALEARITELEHRLTAALRAAETAQQSEALAQRAAAEAWQLV